LTVDYLPTDCRPQQKLEARETGTGIEEAPRYARRGGKLNQDIRLRRILHALGIADADISPTPHSVARDRIATIQIQPLFLLFPSSGVDGAHGVTIRVLHDARHRGSPAARGVTCGMAATAPNTSCPRTDGLTLAARYKRAAISHLLRRSFLSFTCCLFLSHDSSVLSFPCMRSPSAREPPPLDAAAHVALRGMMVALYRHPRILGLGRLSRCLLGTKAHTNRACF
jgi:hypothetical protein